MLFTRTAKSVALAVVAAGVCAVSAQASTIDQDDVKLTTEGYDFGSSAWAAGSPLTAGDLHFHLENGQVRPHLVGTIHLNDADGTCGRMRMEYFDAAGSLLSTNYGGAVCVTDDDHHAWSVDLDPYSDESIDAVKVSLQKQTATGWWTTESDTDTVDPQDEHFVITADGVDFGGPGFDLGQPDIWEVPSVSWNLSDGIVAPRVEGYIHLNNSSGVCARLNLRFLTEAGTFLRSAAGDSVCAADNAHDQGWTELAPYASNRIGQVNVQLQTLASNGTWRVAGSRTVSIAQ